MLMRCRGVCSVCPESVDFIRHELDDVGGQCTYVCIHSCCKEVKHWRRVCACYLRCCIVLHIDQIIQPGVPTPRLPQSICTQQLLPPINAPASNSRLQALYVGLRGSMPIIPSEGQCVATLDGQLVPMPSCFVFWHLGKCRGTSEVLLGSLIQRLEVFSTPLKVKLACMLRTHVSSKSRNLLPQP